MRISENLFREAKSIFGFFVPVPVIREVDMHRDEMVGAEAGVDVKYARKALYGEAGANDERKGEPDFSDNERLAQEIVRAACGRAAFFDRGVDVVTHAEECGRKTCDQCC